MQVGSRRRWRKRERERGTIGDTTRVARRDGARRDDAKPVLGLIPDRDADASRKGARLHEAPRGEDCHSGPVEAPARGRLGECDQEQPGEWIRGSGLGWNRRFLLIHVGRGRGTSVLTVGFSL
jgi:hypothetical protein